MSRIDTSRYYRSHTTSPKGRGGWLFENENEEIVFSYSGTYTEAKKHAQAFAVKTTPSFTSAPEQEERTWKRSKSQKK